MKRKENTVIVYFRESGTGPANIDAAAFDQKLHERADAVEKRRAAEREKAERVERERSERERVAREKSNASGANTPANNTPPAS